LELEAILLLKTEYTLVCTEKQFEAETFPTVVYGIRADKDGKSFYEIPDFSLSESYALKIISLLKEAEPEEVHIAEIIEDLLI
jgi:ATP-dependent RNA circularization protein (DNA/RNA ligase family)